MDWVAEVTLKLKQGNAILFSKSNPLLLELSDFIAQSTHQALILWALEFAAEIAENLQIEYPHAQRLLNAVIMSDQWSRGDIKMRVAQHAILDAHAVAKELTIKEHIALCHALGQACGVVHTPKHALGLPMYELSALVYAHGILECKALVESRVSQYVNRLRYWQQQALLIERPWASFIVKTHLSRSI